MRSAWQVGVGGCWSDETATFLTLLADTKARQAPALLRHSFTNALIHCWSAMFTHAAMHAFAASLLDQDLSGCTTSKATPLPSVRSSLTSPTPPQHQTSSPLPRRPAWTWPSPLHIREPLVYKWLASCPMPGDSPVKQSPCY